MAVFHPLHYPEDLAQIYFCVSSLRVQNGNFKAFDLQQFCVTGRQRWHGDFPSSFLTIQTKSPSQAFFIESLQIRQRRRKFCETVMKIKRLNPQDILVTLTSKLRTQTGRDENIPKGNYTFFYVYKSDIYYKVTYIERKSISQKGVVRVF